MSSFEALTFQIILYAALVILSILSIINFLNHFQFVQCPKMIQRHEEVNGIYPTLILIYILLAMLTLVVLLRYSGDNTYPSCYHSFAATDTHYLFDTHLRNLPILGLLSAQHIIESFFSLSRFYKIFDVQQTQCLLCLPSTLYLSTFLLLKSVSIVVYPALAILSCVFHVAVNITFSFRFHRSIKESYAHLFEDDVDSPMAQFQKAVYRDIEEQIAQIFYMSLLSSLCSIISAFSWLSVYLCHYLPGVPVTLTLNCCILYFMFTKNRIFVRYLVCCKCQLLARMAQSPCSLLRPRRSQNFISRRWTSMKSQFSQSSVFNLNFGPRARLRRRRSSQQQQPASKPRAPAHSLQASSDVEDVAQHPSQHPSLEVSTMSFCEDIDPTNQIFSSSKDQMQANFSSGSIVVPPMTHIVYEFEPAVEQKHDFESDNFAGSKPRQLPLIIEEEAPTSAMQMTGAAGVSSLQHELEKLRINSSGDGDLLVLHSRFAGDITVPSTSRNTPIPGSERMSSNFGAAVEAASAETEMVFVDEEEENEAQHVPHGRLEIESKPSSSQHKKNQISFAKDIAFSLIDFEDDVPANETPSDMHLKPARLKLMDHATEPTMESVYEQQHEETKQKPELSNLQKTVSPQMVLSQSVTRSLETSPRLDSDGSGGGSIFQQRNSMLVNSSSTLSDPSLHLKNGAPQNESGQIARFAYKQPKKSIKEDAILSPKLVGNRPSLKRRHSLPLPVLPAALAMPPKSRDSKPTLEAPRNSLDRDGFPGFFGLDSRDAIAIPATSPRSPPKTADTLKTPLSATLETPDSQRIDSPQSENNPISQSKPASSFFPWMSGSASKKSTKGTIHLSAINNLLSENGLSTIRGPSAADLQEMIFNDVRKEFEITKQRNATLRQQSTFRDMTSTRL